MNRNKINENVQEENEEENKKGGLLFLKRMRIALGSLAAVVALSAGGYKLVKDYNDNTPKNSIESQTEDNTDDTSLPFDYNTDDLDDKDNINNNSKEDTKDNKNDSKTTISDSNEDDNTNSAKMNNEEHNVNNDSSNSNNNKNNNDENNSNDNKPNKSHHHHYELESIEYSSNGSNKVHTKTEIWVCPEDGAKKVKVKSEKHTLGEATNTEYKNVDKNNHEVIKTHTCEVCEDKNIKIITVEGHTFELSEEARVEIPGNDEVHQLKKVYKCAHDEATKTKITTEKHTYGEVKDNGDGTTSKECEECNHTAVHEHDFQYDRTEYEKGNNDTHIKKDIYVCPEDGAINVKVLSEEHTLGEATNIEYNNVDKNNHEVIETHTCEVCENENIKITTVEEHAFELVGESREEIIGNDEVHQLKKTYKCSHDEATKEEKTEEKHTYGETKDNGDGTTTKECEECNHTAVHEHDFQYDRTEHEKGNNDTHIKKYIYVCPEDGKEDIRVTSEKHTLGEATNTEYNNVDENNHEVIETHTCEVCEDENIKITIVEEHAFELVGESREEIIGNDEVHQLKKTYKCSHDEATKEEKTEEKHTYGETKDNGDGTTTKECEECNHTAVHEHDFQLNRSEYEKVDDNTHKRTDIYVCPEDGAEDIKETIENHTKGELQSSETKKISAALHETTEVHKCGSGECEGIVETAKTAGHTYEHKDYIETPEDASYCEKEELECSGCNDVIIRGHIEHQWTDLSNGDKACTNCGTLLSETNQPHKHNFQLNRSEYEKIDDNTHKRTDIYVCPVDGVEDIKEPVVENHTKGELQSSETKKINAALHETTEVHKCGSGECEGIVETTETVGHTYEHKDYIETPEDANYCEKEELECSGCNDVIIRGHIEHQWTDLSNGDKACTNCGTLLSETNQPHKHNFQLNRSEYEKIDDNTHKRTDIYVCPVDGVEDIKEPVVENHTKGELQSSETKKISAALHETTEVHKCGSGECEGIVETAKTAGHTYEHKDYIETPEDASYCEKEELECSGCNDVIIRGHIEHQWTDLSNGDKACTNCGTLLSETDQPSQSSEVIALNDKQISMDFISKCLEEFLYSVYEEETNEKRVATNKKNKQKVLTLG